MNEKVKINSNCRYRVNGNLCRFEYTCSDKDYFETPVTFQKYKIYGVCDSASCF